MRAIRSGLPCVIGLVLGSVPCLSSAQYPVAWTGRGPWGGRVTDLKIDPVTPSTLYAATGGGVFKSTDAGVTWAPAGTYSRAIGVEALAIDPSNPQRVYASETGGAIWRTNDGGGTWSWFYYNGRIGIDPANPARMYVGGSANAGVTNDDGVNWVYSLQEVGTHFLSVAVQPGDGSVAYLGSDVGNVDKTTDGGLTWIRTTHGTGLVRIWDIAIDPTDPQRIYVGCIRGVYKSPDGGATWVPANGGIANNYVESLAIDASMPGTIWAGAVTYWHYPGGVFKSVNGGDTWVRADAGLTSSEVHAVAVDPHESLTAYAATDDGVFKTTDGGSSWRRASVGLQGFRVATLDVSPSDPRVMTAAAGTSGIFRSVDGGLTWGAVGAGSKAVSSAAVVSDPSDPAVLFSGTADGIWKSVDGGATWPDAWHGLSKANVCAIAVDPRDPRRVYALSNQRAPSRSLDGGATWEYNSVYVVQTFGERFRIAIDPRDPLLVFAAGGDLWRSVDGGANWSQSCRSSSAVAVGFDAAGQRFVYSANGHLVVSLDDGVTWPDPGHSPPPFKTNVLAVDPVNPHVVYAGTEEDGVVASYDGGHGWHAINPGLANLAVVDLVFDPANPRRLFAATRGTGIFSLDIPDDPAIVTPCPLPWRVRGSNVQESLSVIGGEPPYDWSASSGVLPPGLSLDGGQGVISGRPTAAGSWSFVIGVRDGRGHRSEKECGVSVAWPLQLAGANANIGRWISGTTVAWKFTASGGVRPYRWGFHLAPVGLRDVHLGADGLLTATVSATNRYASLGVIVRDASGQSAAAEIRVAVEPPRIRRRAP